MRLLVAVSLTLFVVVGCSSAIQRFEGDFTLDTTRPVEVEVVGDDKDAVKAMREALLEKLPLPVGGMGPGCACYRMKVAIARVDAPSRVASALMGVFAGSAVVDADVYIDGIRRFSVHGESAYGNAFVSSVEFAAKEAAARIVGLWNTK